MLLALSVIEIEQAKPTTKTLRKMEQFFHYVAMNSDAIVMYQASNMILAMHTNASYLSKPKAWSRVGGHFFLSRNTTVPPQQWLHP